MGTGEQLVTVAAVLLGAVTTHVTNHLMERNRTRYQLLTRWDDRKLDAYANYIDQVRSGVYAAVHLYEQREGIRDSGRSDQELVAELAETARVRGRAFERVLLLGGDDAVEAAHELNVRIMEVDWQAKGETTGTLDEWRERHRAVFGAINAFYDEVRADLGVSGSVTGERHPERDLLLPPQGPGNGDTGA
ncbi:hypothetical protein RKE29_01055 [Streptomyces sp. B1866]|uniref:hypothetical protein n=1 Tax=Streptomyces sp. B1866 TaxID=3075431 RepID=UPI0028913AE4|nr:hypothetical protein [Streptomyces sp. B1866]MDT3395250.1 hypothetical protein [Streptomyces sp. B1866]